LENSTNSPRSAEGRESEDRHGDGVNNGESQKPCGYPGVPLPPDSYCAVKSKSREKSAYSFMKKLPGSTPPHAPGDL